MQATQPPPLRIRRIFILRSLFALDCPNCGETIERYVVGTRSTIGHAVSACPACRQEFGTRQSEWATKSSWQKAAFFLKQTWAVAYIGGVLSFLALIGLGLLDDGLLDRSPWIAIVPGLVFLVLRVRKARQQVADSLARTQVPAHPAVA